MNASQSVLFVFRQVGLVLAFAIFLSLFNGHLQELGHIYDKVTVFTSIYKLSTILVFACVLLGFLFKKKGNK